MANFVLTGRWYTRLKPSEKGGLSLFSQISRQLCYSYFLVYSLDDNGYRKYGAFRSSVEFYHYYIDLYKPEMHEIVLGEKQQKFRVDVDLTPDKTPEGISLWDFGSFIRELIIDSLESTLLEYGITLDISKNIIYCSSHSHDWTTGTYGPNSKFSAHIILADYFHSNYEEALYFFDRVIDKSDILREAVKNGIIDRGIYSTNHSMRLLGSYKNGVRIKTLVSEIEHHDQNIIFNHDYSKIDKKLNIFKRSCITDTVGCKRITIKLPPKEIPKYNKLDLPDGYEDLIIEMLNKYEGKGIYEIRKSVSGGLIELERKHPSMCKICHRPHDNIDPFLQITSGGIVNYYCRQSKGLNGAKHKHKMIGLLKIQKEKYLIEKEDKKKYLIEKEEIYKGCDYNLLRDMAKQTYRYPIK